MSIDYYGARIGERCRRCGVQVRVTSMKRLLAGKKKNPRVIVQCDCNCGCYRLTKAERAALLAVKRGVVVPFRRKRLLRIV